MIASGASMIILASSLTKVLTGTRSIEAGTQSRSYVEQEALYKVRAWLAILSLGCFGEGERKLVLGVRRRGHGVVYIVERASTAKETTSHYQLTIRYVRYTASRSSVQRLGASGARHGCGCTPSSSP